MNVWDQCKSLDRSMWPLFDQKWLILQVARQRCVMDVWCVCFGFVGSRIVVSTWLMFWCKVFGFVGSKTVKLTNDKPVISPPSNFEHTVHVGFDPHTGEFTVSQWICWMTLIIRKNSPDSFSHLLFVSGIMWQLYLFLECWGVFHNYDKICVWQC